MQECHLKEERLELDGIPCLVVQQDDADSGAPLILHYHGWHSSKEDQRFLASLLAGRGYRVVLPDVDKHGERSPIDYDAPGALADNFWPIILNSADEAGALIRALQREIGARPGRVVVSGWRVMQPWRPLPRGIRSRAARPSTRDRFSCCTEQPIR